MINMEDLKKNFNVLIQCKKINNIKKVIFILFLLLNIFELTNIAYAKDEYKVKHYDKNKLFNIQNKTQYNISNNFKFNSLKEEKILSSYNSVKKGYVTNIKNQGSYGTCWSFATIAAIESSLIKNNNIDKNIDLSEAQLVYFSFNKAYDRLNLINNDYNKIINGENYLNIGGNYYLSMFLLTAGYGVSNENKMKYTSLKNNTYYNSILAFNSDYTIKNNFLVPMNQVNNIKKCIIKYGSVASAFNYNKENLNKKTNAYYQIQNKHTNHAIAIVGWNDNYPKTNFLSKPNNNGAWLIKNSWGKNWGINGYFWISYEDYSIKNTFASCYEMNDSNKKFLNRYQYDGTASTSYVSKPTYYQSNIYVAQTNESLSDIGFFTDEENLFYEISIYKNVHKIPTDGILINTYTGYTTFTGYHSVELSEKIVLNKNDRFSIVIKLTDKNNLPSYVLIDTNSKWKDWLEFVSHSNSGESFISQDNKTWTDISIKLKANCRIKALTIPILTSSIDKDTNKEYFTEETNNINNLSINKISYSKSKAKNGYYIIIKPQISGGCNTKQYKYIIKNSKNKTIVNKNYSKNNSYKILLKNKNTYTITCYVKDTLGYECFKTIKVKI